MTPTSWAAQVQAWQSFYLLTGGASATLVGLMFVAVTFGAGLVDRQRIDAARSFIDPTFNHFVQVLLFACMLVVPSLSPRLLGTITVAAGALRLTSLVSVFRHYREAHRVHQDVEASDWLMAVGLPGAAYLLLATTGVGFIVGHARALDGLALVTLVVLAIGVRSAWETLVWMAVAISGRRDSTATDKNS
jgi:hypothetical protein